MLQMYVWCYLHDFSMICWFVDEKAILNENFMTCWRVWWLITLCFRSIGAFILCFFLQVVSYIECCYQCVTCFCECACMHGGTKSLCRLCRVWFSVEIKVWNFVGWLFFKIHIAIKWHKVSNVHTTDTLYLHIQSLGNTCFIICGIAAVDYQ